MPEIRMPKMGDGMEEGTILRWLRQEGDKVAAEDPIAEIETDKANVEIPAEEAGTLSKIVVREGETVPVGAVIAYVGEAGPPVAPPAGTAPGAAAEPTVTDRTPTGEAGTAPRDAFAPAPPPPVGAPGEAPEAERIKASPLARRMAEEMGIDLAQVQGTGPGGRIVERDVREFAEKRPAAPPPVPIGPPPAGPVPVAAAPLAAPAAPNLAGQDVEVSKMRRAIARRTVLSKQTVPHFYLVMPVDMDRAMDLLADLNAQAPDQKITVNDLIVKACAVALERLPDVNVSYTPDDKIRRYDTINIGVAVGTDAGLTIPVVTDCGHKSLRQIAADTKALVGKARSGSLVPQDMSGGTFTVSNLGMFGIEEFLAIISPPESAILAVGTVAPEVQVADDGSFVAKRRMRVSLSCDHRAVDGLLGARFLKELRGLLESPLNLLS